MATPSLREWFFAVRPKTLTAAIVPVFCGFLIVLRQDPHAASLVLTLLALLCALLIQVGTNLFNDVVDYKSGVDSASRSGPKRLIQSGLISSTRLTAAAHSCFFLACLFALPLVLKGGIPILLIGLLSTIAGYSYSAPPLKLAYRGWAEPFVILFFGVLAVTGIELLLVGKTSAIGFYTGLQLGLAATALMVINNIRDENEDKKAGKQTLVARFGFLFGVVELALLYIIVIFLNLIPPLYTLPLIHLSLLWMALFFVVLVSVIIYKDKKLLNRSLALAALAHLALGVVRCIQLTL